MKLARAEFPALAFVFALAFGAQGKLRKWANCPAGSASPDRAGWGALLLRNEIRGFMMVLGAATLWGICGTTAKVLFVRSHIASVDLVGVRLWLSGLLLLAWVLFTQPGSLLAGRAHWPKLVLFGTVGLAAVQFFYFYAIEQTSVAIAIFLQYLAPALVAAWDVAVRGRRLSSGRGAALMLAVGGSLLLVLGARQGIRLNPLGAASGLLAAVCVAFYSLYAERAMQDLAPAPLLAYGLLIGAAFWSLVSPPWRWQGLGFTVGSWGGFLYIAVFGTVIPFTLYLHGLRHLDSGRSTLIATLEPVVGALTAFALLGETLSWLQVGGGALIIAAVLLLQFHP